MLQYNLMGKATEEKNRKGVVVVEVLNNFVGGSPVAAEVEEELEVPDPATEELLGRVPLSGKEDVDRAVRAAAEAFEEWREEPVTRRARRMFKLQVLLEDNVEDLAELCTRENGKHVEESKGEILRGIEVVELAASMTTLMKGETLDQVSQGVDCTLHKEPLGVVTARSVERRVGKECRSRWSPYHYKQNGGTHL